MAYHPSPAVPNVRNFAAPPFDKESHCDIILRSCDGVHFCVSKHILSIASPVFADMFSLSPPIDATAADEVYDGLSIVSMAEDAATLDLLLRWCYPVSSPPLMTLEDARRMVTATRKFDIQAFDDAVQDALEAHLVLDPVGVLEIASLDSFDELARRAVRATLRLPLSTIASSASAGRLGKSQLGALIQYHLSCGAAAASVTTQREFFKQLPAPALFREGSNSTCNLCFSIDPLFKPADSDKIRFSLGQLQGWCAPRYIWRFLDAAGRTLLLQPHEDAITSLCETENCIHCSGRHNMERSTTMFVQTFVREVNAAIEQVPIPTFVAGTDTEQFSGLELTHTRGGQISSSLRITICYILLMAIIFSSGIAIGRQI
ncbi:hypothetical protein FA95DRAFT_1564754 [Auriscalpium vulgare]|uniref:Uncharacterized protein n=1 Tax=Auriscalpium vulgare TaxID=40419 RepID=A0ACB8RD27_9AGAM|nr:hypothetical protein FA95DRAFT_1564754 [Auriscalpium vulgare]